MSASVSLDLTTLARLADADSTVAEDTALESATTLDRFLASVERRAFRIAQMAVRDRDDAFDIVQGAMMRLASSYGRRPSEGREIETNRGGHARRLVTRSLGFGRSSGKKRQSRQTVDGPS